MHQTLTVFSLVRDLVFESEEVTPHNLPPCDAGFHHTTARTAQSAEAMARATRRQTSSGGRVATSPAPGKGKARAGKKQAAAKVEIDHNTNLSSNFFILST